METIESGAPVYEKEDQEPIEFQKRLGNLRLEKIGLECVQGHAKGFDYCKQSAQNAMHGYHVVID